MKMLKVKITLLLVLMAVTVFAQVEVVQTLVQEGIELHDKGAYPQAIAKYEKALKIDPESSLAHYEIAFSYMAAQDYKNAEKHCKEVIDFNKEHVVGAYIGYGNALDLQGKTLKAIEAYEEGMKKFDNYLLYYNHAYTCIKYGDTDKGYASLLKAVQNNPWHASSHLLLSQLMQDKGSRVKAILPLYFFLLIEPNTDRGVIEYSRLRTLMDQGVTRSSETNIDVVVPSSQDPDFGAAELMISLLKASNSLEENKDKTDLELFAENTDNLFKTLGELKKENTGFWWDFYVPYYYDLATENLTESYSYYISISRGEEPNQWISDHEEDFQRFTNWVNE